MRLAAFVLLAGVVGFLLGLEDAGVEGRKTRLPKRGQRGRRDGRARPLSKALWPERQPRMDLPTHQAAGFGPSRLQMEKKNTVMDGRDETGTVGDVVALNGEGRWLSGLQGAHSQMGEHRRAGHRLVGQSAAWRSSFRDPVSRRLARQRRSLALGETARHPSQRTRRYDVDGILKQHYGYDDDRDEKARRLRERLQNWQKHGARKVQKVEPVRLRGPLAGKSNGQASNSWGTNTLRENPPGAPRSHQPPQSYLPPPVRATHVNRPESIPDGTSTFLGGAKFSDPSSILAAPPGSSHQVPKNRKRLAPVPPPLRPPVAPTRPLVPPPPPNPSRPLKRLAPPPPPNRGFAPQPFAPAPPPGPPPAAPVAPKPPVAPAHPGGQPAAVKRPAPAPPGGRPAAVKRPAPAPPGGQLAAVKRHAPAPPGGPPAAVKRPAPAPPGSQSAAVKRRAPTPPVGQRKVSMSEPLPVGKNQGGFNSKKQGGFIKRIRSWKARKNGRESGAAGNGQVQGQRGQVQGQRPRRLSIRQRARKLARKIFRRTPKPNSQSHWISSPSSNSPRHRTSSITSRTSLLGSGQRNRRFRPIANFGRRLRRLRNFFPWVRRRG